MADAKSKIVWEANNVCRFGCKVNRNQNPELYQILMASESKSGKARELMELGLKYMNEHPEG